MIDINNETYPLNLLDAMSDSVTGWNYQFPIDIEASIEYVLCFISDRERTVIKMRYQEGKSYKETAAALGLSNSYIRSIESHALRKLCRGKNKDFLKYGVSGTLERARHEGEEKAVSLKLSEAFENIRRIADALQEIIPKEDLQKVCDILDAPVPDTDITDLDLTVRSYNVLSRAGIKTLYQISAMSIDELAKLRNLSKKSYDEIVVKVHSCGLKFKGEDKQDELENYTKSVYGEFLEENDVF